MAWTTRRGIRRKTKLIAARYSPKDLSGKLACKKNLLEVFGLPPESVNKPVIGIVSRFAGQKGFDLIEQVAPDLLAEDVAIAALGAGEPKYEKLLRELAEGVSRKTQRESGVRQYPRAQDRSGSGHVPDALAVRTLRLESDLQFEVRYGARGAGHGRPGRHDRSVRSGNRTRHGIQVSGV